MQDKIEELIQNREAARAKKQIQHFLNVHHHDEASIFKACSWYRRLGLYREGYLLVVPKRWRLSHESTSTPVGKHLLWCARFLNLLGARGHALQIMDRLEVKGATSLAISAELYFRAYEFEKSCESSEKHFKLKPNPESWKSRMDLISFCHSLRELGKVSQALKKLGTLRIAENEHLLQATAYYCEGRCLADLGEYSKAHELLTRAYELFPGIRDSEYATRFVQALAFVKAKLGMIAEAEVLFQKCAKNLKAPGMSTEIFFENHWMMYQVGLLPKKEIPYLSGYPGLPEAFLKRTGMPSPPIFQAKKGREKICIMPARREWLEKGKPRFGLTKEILLLAYLKQAGHHGISLTRLKSLLWPDQPGSFAVLEARIFNLLKVLRNKYKFRAQVQRGIVYLSPSSQDQVSVETSHKPLATKFYELRPEFVARNFAEYYGFSKAQAARILTSEVEQGHLVIKLVSGKSSLRYIRP